MICVQRRGEYVPWIHVYRLAFKDPRILTVEDCDAHEKNLIVKHPLETSSYEEETISKFQYDDIILDRIAKDRLSERFGRSNLGRLLSALEQLDKIISDATDLPPVDIYIHHNLYGESEFAHVPLRQPGYISVNLSNPRIRQLLVGVLKKDRISTCAIFDLLLHEKAHLSLYPNKGHDIVFYYEKARIRRLATNRLLENKNRDPFRRSSFSNTWLPDARHIRGLFPDLVCEKRDPNGKVKV